jgi:RNA recognition motif-containing protein
MASSEERSPRQSRDRSRSPKQTTSLLVRNLVRPTQDYKVKSDEVKEFYSRFGEVRDVYLPVDYYTRKARGFGFVEFLKYEDAKSALEQTDNVEVMGSVVKVVFAREGRKAVNFNAACRHED